ATNTVSGPCHLFVFEYVSLTETTPSATPSVVRTIMKQERPRMSPRIGASSSQPPFAMTGLSSRGGLSNWVFFFSPTDVVMIDLGIGPALKAGARAGVASQFGLAGAALGGSGRGPPNGGPAGLPGQPREHPTQASNAQ